jgi:hypothetical protein
MWSFDININILNYIMHHITQFSNGNKVDFLDLENNIWTSYNK